MILHPDILIPLNSNVPYSNERLEQTLNSIIVQIPIILQVEIISPSKDYNSNDY